jgi:hypothetical protein
MNICGYAEHFTIIVRVTPKQIFMEGLDEGRGIADIAFVTKEGYSTVPERVWRMSFGAGMDQADMKHFSDFFNIASGLGNGTHVKKTIQID